MDAGSVSPDEKRLPTSTLAWTYSSASSGLESNIHLVTQDVPKALLSPKDGQVLVEVLSMSLNPADYALAEFTILSRLLIAKPASPGLDLCGRVVGQGQRRIVGRLDWPCQHGSLGQYVVLGKNNIVDLPPNIDVDKAAAVPTCALTAYQSIVPHVRPGDSVFINGGSGGVGTFSIQIAKLMGCRVTVSCSGKNAMFCRELGADAVVDYTQGDIVEELSRRKERFDLVVDNVGADKGLHRKCERFLKPEGLFVLVAATIQDAGGVLSMLSSWMRPSWLGGPKRRWKFILTRIDKKQLQQVFDWVENGEVRVIVDEVFDFYNAPRAIEKIKTGRARGKVVVKGVSASTKL